MAELTYKFDESGNQRTVEVPSGDLTTYAWDFENQLVSVENPAGEITTYAYTGLDQRLSAETENAVQKFLWDGQNILQEYDDLDVTQAVWTLDPQPEPQPYGNLLSQSRDSESSFYHADALGSTRALTDDSEVVTDEAAYQAFGGLASSTGTTENPFQWIGQKGIYTQDDARRWMRAREYDVQQGRFLSEDPLAFQGGDSNFYRYVGNDPASRRDPSGQGDGYPAGLMQLTHDAPRLTTGTETSHGRRRHIAARKVMDISRRMDLRERVVLITRGSRRPGLMLAREFAQSGPPAARDAAELTRAADDLRGYWGLCSPSV